MGRELLLAWQNGAFAYLPNCPWETVRDMLGRHGPPDRFCVGDTWYVLANRRPPHAPARGRVDGYFCTQCEERQEDRQDCLEHTRRTGHPSFYDPETGKLYRPGSDDIAGQL
jgi:hypothetical protein